jgi:hypothetical protein
MIDFTPSEQQLALKTLSHTAQENPGAFHPRALKAYKELGAVK